MESRIKEGERLRADLVEKLDGMISYVDYIEERSPQILEEYRMRLESKVQELLGDRQLDDARIAAEITIFADKICVDEETVRLRSHILSMKETLLAGGGMGRKDVYKRQQQYDSQGVVHDRNTPRFGLHARGTGGALSVDAGHCDARRGADRKHSRIYGVQKCCGFDVLSVSYTHLDVYKRQVLDMIEQLIDEDSAIVSIYYGEDAREEAANAIGEKITEAHPDVEVEVHDGGQPIYYYVISVE